LNEYYGLFERLFYQMNMKNKLKIGSPVLYPELQLESDEGPWGAENSTSESRVAPETYP
jgi:hypothetical protein